jgi:hypothetical protein
VWVWADHPDFLRSLLSAFPTKGHSGELEPLLLARGNDISMMSVMTSTPDVLYWLWKRLCSTCERCWDVGLPLRPAENNQQPSRGVSFCACLLVRTVSYEWQRRSSVTIPLSAVDRVPEFGPFHASSSDHSIPSFPGLTCIRLVLPLRPIPPRADKRTSGQRVAVSGPGMLTG